MLGYDARTLGGDYDTRVLTVASRTQDADGNIIALATAAFDSYTFTNIHEANTLNRDAAPFTSVPSLDAAGALYLMGLTGATAVDAVNTQFALGPDGYGHGPADAGHHPRAGAQRAERGAGGRHADGDAGARDHECGAAGHGGHAGDHDLGRRAGERGGGPGLADREQGVHGPARPGAAEQFRAHPRRHDADDPHLHPGAQAADPAGEEDTVTGVIYQWRTAATMAGLDSAAWSAPAIQPGAWNPGTGSNTPEFGIATALGANMERWYEVAVYTVDDGSPIEEISTNSDGEAAPTTEEYWCGADASGAAPGATATVIPTAAPPTETHTCI